MKESVVWFFLVGVCVLVAARVGAGEVLHNGIVLPDAWPPKYDRPPNDPMPVPTGASHGYVAAGGPGFDSPIDATGSH